MKRFDRCEIHHFAEILKISACQRVAIRAVDQLASMIRADVTFVSFARKTYAHTVGTLTLDTDTQRIARNKHNSKKSNGA